MMQIIPQTHDEKVKMYMECSKKKLIEMLIQCNNIIGSLTKETTAYIHENKKGK